MLADQGAYIVNPLLEEMNTGGKGSKRPRPEKDKEKEPKVNKNASGPQVIFVYAEIICVYTYLHFEK